jgi:hypothetical protein
MHSSIEAMKNFELGSDGTRCIMSPLIRLAGRAAAPASLGEGGMVDGFHWTRVTSKQLRFLYEDVTTVPPPPKMKELADAIDRGLAAASGAETPPAVADDAPES